jgi:hypothetical protein
MDAVVMLRAVTAAAGDDGDANAELFLREFYSGEH